MFSRPIKSFPAALRLCVPLAVGLSLTACSGIDNGQLDDVYKPVDSYQRYPIEVAKGTVRLQVPTNSARLSPAMEDAVTRFGQEAATSGAKRVYVRRPTGTMTADVVAGRVTQLLAEQGVSAGLMSHSTYRAAAGAPVELSFTRKFAVTAECGDWSTSLTETGQNDGYPNFGCAQQHNLAATVANPEDFVTPRTETPADAMRRAQAIEDFRTPKSPATPETGDTRVEIAKSN